MMTTKKGCQYFRQQ